MIHDIELCRFKVDYTSMVGFSTNTLRFSTGKNKQHSLVVRLMTMPIYLNKTKSYKLNTTHTHSPAAVYVYRGLLISIQHYRGVEIMDSFNSKRVHFSSISNQKQTCTFELLHAFSRLRKLIA